MAETEDYLQQMHNWLNQLHNDLSKTSFDTTTASSLPSPHKHPTSDRGQRGRSPAHSKSPAGKSAYSIAAKATKEPRQVADSLMNKAKAIDSNRRQKAAPDPISPFRPLFRSNSNLPKRSLSPSVDLQRFKDHLRSPQLQSLEAQDFKPRASTPDLTKASVEMRLTTMKELYELSHQHRVISKVEHELGTVKSPSLCKRSEQLAAKVNGSRRVEERLIESGRRTTLELRAKADIMHREAKLRAKPSVTTLARAIRLEPSRDGDFNKPVEERLLQYGEKYRGRSEKRALLDKEVFSFNPKLYDYKRSNWSPYRSHSKTTLLQSSQSHTFTPIISKKSQNLALKRGPSQDRLLTKSAKPADVDRGLAACTFSPKLSQKTLDLTRSRSPHRDVWADLNKSRPVSRPTLDLSEIDSECTFTPMTHSSPTTFSHVETLHRLQNWATYREEKLRKLISSELNSSVGSR